MKLRYLFLQAILFSARNSLLSRIFFYRPEISGLGEKRLMKDSKQAATETDKGLQWLPFDENDSEKAQSQKDADTGHGAGDEVQSVKQEQPEPPDNGDMLIDDDLIF